MKKLVCLLLTLFVFYVYLKPPYAVTGASFDNGSSFIADRIVIFSRYIETYNNEVRDCSGVSRKSGILKRIIPWESIIYISRFKEKEPQKQSDIDSKLHKFKPGREDRR